MPFNPWFVAPVQENEEQKQNCTRSFVDTLSSDSSCVCLARKGLSIRSGRGFSLDPAAKFWFGSCYLSFKVCKIMQSLKMKNRKTLANSRCCCFKIVQGSPQLINSSSITNLYAINLSLSISRMFHASSLKALHEQASNRWLVNNIILSWWEAKAFRNSSFSSTSLNFSEED